MLVKDILKGKGSEVFSTPSAATMAEAAKLLMQRKVGALVVHDREAPLAGLITEREVVSAIGEMGGNALAEPVKTYMLVKIQTCREHHTVEDLLVMMTHSHCRHVPVLDEAGEVCGIISIGDLIKVRIPESVNAAISDSA